MATELEVKLTADIQQLRRQLDVAEGKLRNFGNQADKQGTRAGKGFTRAGKGAANAVPTLLEFNRVVQDAPFGIQGVANNIQQLTQNFGHLRQSVGGTVPALRLLLSSMAGPAGILFAVSTITSLLVVFGDELFKSKKSADALKKSMESLNDSFDAELRLSKAVEESLELQGKSTTGILNKRKDLIRLQIQTLSLQIQQQQELLNTQIAENQTISNWEAIVGWYNQAVTGLTSIFKITSAIAISTAKSSDTLKSLLAPLLLATDQFKASSRATAASAKDIEKQRALQTRLNSLKAQQLELENDILKINQAQTAELKFKVAVVPNPFANFIEPDLLSGQAKTAFQNLSKVLAEDGPTIIAPQLSNIEQRFADFKERLAASTLDLASAVSGGFAQLGQSLAQGAGLFNSVGAAILSIMGDIATQLGQAAIAAGIAGLALKNLFANPFAAIAAGGALVAIGAALKSAQSAVSGIGGGGSVAGQGSSGSSSFSGATVSGGGSFNGRVVFEISGQKLIGVLNNSLSANQRLGGNVSLG